MHVMTEVHCSVCDRISKADLTANNLSVKLTAKATGKLKKSKIIPS